MDLHRWGNLLQVSPLRGGVTGYTGDPCITLTVQDLGSQRAPRRSWKAPKLSKWAPPNCRGTYELSVFAPLNCLGKGQKFTGSCGDLTAGSPLSWETTRSWPSDEIDAWQSGQNALTRVSHWPTFSRNLRPRAYSAEPNWLTSPFSPNKGMRAIGLPFNVQLFQASHT